LDGVEDIIKKLSLQYKQKAEKAKKLCAVFVLKAGDDLVKIGYAYKIQLDSRPLDVDLADVAFAAWFTDSHLAHRVEARVAATLKAGGKHRVAKFYDVSPQMARSAIETAARELNIEVMVCRSVRRLTIKKQKRELDDQQYATWENKERLKKVKVAAHVEMVKRSAARKAKAA
jgi:hypothetical protein